jgi:hypothetical protein
MAWGVRDLRTTGCHARQEQKARDNRSCRHGEGWKVEGSSRGIELVGNLNNRRIYRPASLYIRQAVESNLGADLGTCNLV